MKECRGLRDAEGLCLPNQQKIMLRRTRIRSRMRDTLIHELVHAFLLASGLDHFIEKHLRPGVKWNGEDGFEEMLVKLMTPHVAMLIDELRGGTWTF